MITVRFSTGFSIQYNDASYTVRDSNCTLLYTNDLKATIIAIVPHSSGAIVEHKSPCRTYNPIATDSDKVQAEITQLSKEIRSLKRKLGSK